MEKKQKSLLGKDASDQYLAGLEDQFTKVWGNAHKTGVCKSQFLTLFSLLSDARQQVNCVTINTRQPSNCT